MSVLEGNLGTGSPHASEKRFSLRGLLDGRLDRATNSEANGMLDCAGDTRPCTVMTVLGKIY